MFSLVLKSFAVLVLIELCGAQRVGTPPKVEDQPVLLESYLPATMQILAYLTEMMKYDLKPQTTPIYGSTTSTMRPTPYHRPAIFAPLKPPGPDAYYQSVQKDNTYREYIESLKRPSGINYFDRYKQALETRSSRNLDNGDNDDILEGVATYFGRNFIDTLKLVKGVEKDVPNDIDEQSQEFLKKYDDSNFRTELLRQKQVPPTRAYVSLLSLYDMLNKESKRLGLSKYNKNKQLDMDSDSDFEFENPPPEIVENTVMVTRKQFNVVTLGLLPNYLLTKKNKQLDMDSDSDFEFENPPPEIVENTVMVTRKQFNVVTLGLLPNYLLTKGYTQKILEELVDSSSSTSAYQLHVVFKKVVERRDVTRQDIVNKIKQLTTDLEDSNGYLNSALKYIPPLAFSL